MRPAADRTHVLTNLTKKTLASCSRPERAQAHLHDAVEVLWLVILSCGNIDLSCHLACEF